MFSVLLESGFFESAPADQGEVSVERRCGHRTCVASRPVSPNKARMEKRASVGAADTTATIFGILERLAAPFEAKSSDPLANLALQHS